MHRRATSKEGAVEAEQEIDMEDKEATPVEDVETILPPAEPNKPAPQEEQLKKSTTKEDTKLDKMMEMLLREFKTTKEESGNKIGDTNKKIEENNEEMKSDNQGLKEELRENSKKMEEKMEENRKKAEESSKLLKEELLSLIHI